MLFLTSAAQDGLESCRRSMEAREVEYLEEARRLGASALVAKRAGNRVLARTRVLERRRVVKRLDKLRNGLSLVDAQIEAIRMSELDREIVESLRASTTAMKKAGIGAAIEDAERLLGDMDEQLKDTQDLTSVLSTPLNQAATEEEADLDLELEWLEPLEDAGQSFAPRRAKAVEPEPEPESLEVALAPEAEACAGRGGDELPDQEAHPALPGV